MAFLYENLPLWTMSFPFSLIHWDDLRIYLNLYSTEKHVPEVIREFHITFVKLIFVEAFLVGAHKYDSILRKMNDVAPTYSKGDEEAVASLVLGELKEEEKSKGKGKKKHDESNDTRHPPLYNLRRVDDNSPRSDWVWNMFLVTELLQPGNRWYPADKTPRTIGSPRSDKHDHGCHAMQPRARAAAAAAPSRVAVRRRAPLPAIPRWPPSRPLIEMLSLGTSRDPRQTWS